jgi:hypothetical protein
MLVHGALIGTRCLTGCYFVTTIVAMEEVMPRTIRNPETTSYVVALILTLAISLVIVVAALELLQTKFIFP